MKTTCIMCPLSCELTATYDGKNYSISGNNCVRGSDYYLSELTKPMRSITALVKYKGGVAPVKSSAPIPRDKLFDVLKLISTILLDKKPRFHTVIIKNILNLGVDIVAT